MQNEFDLYITPDGKEYHFSDLLDTAPIARWVTVEDGHGASDLQLITQQGAQQDGETLLDYRLGAREIILLHGRGSCTRSGYWAARADLLNHLRPNRGASRSDACGVLRKILPNGDKRDIKALATAGPRFAARRDGGWHETTYLEQIRFYCPDPIFYDPDAVSVNMTGEFCTDLVFPFEFPFAFCAKGNVVTDTITYSGTWLEYPIFYVTGETGNVEINNLTTGEKIELNYSIPASVTVTIDLRYGYKTVTDSLGNNLIGSISTDSDIATWHLAPDPEAPGGVNQLSITGDQSSGTTALSMRYYTRYYGI